MVLHAVDDLSDALSTTRRFLLPVEWRRWLKLALLSLFVAGGSGGGTPINGAQYTLEGTELPFMGMPFGDASQIGAVIEQNLGLLVGLIAVVFLISLVLAWISATFEFALLESIRTEDVKVRAYASDFAGLGTRLFAFRLLFGLGLAVLFGGVALLVIAPVVVWNDPRPLFFLVALAPVFFVVAIVASVIYVLTTAFVAPIMLLEDRGVISAWRRFWATFKADWEQFLVFLLVGIFVMIAIGIGVGIVTAVLAVVVAIPFAIIFFLVFFGSGGAIVPVAAVLLGIPAFVAFLALMAIVQVPVQTYLRYWALLVLGDVDEELDLIPEQREAVRVTGDS
ncbi:MAG: hypothetical protein ABEI31_06820 [Halodesulfurarchaeum sp.]